ncbi:F-box/FBD/LRR-repeat protein At1g13570 [Euphorbia peplus]|nr:F-box/FBD/LRR-repeat protein At1g13570 [Euphorbia peplus]
MPKISQGFPGNEHDNRDRLSDLPDEIITNILSRLHTVNHACRTALVSRRFENFCWTYIIGPNLKFSYDHIELFNLYFRDDYNLISLRKWEISRSIVDRKRQLFVGLLSRVLKCYRNPNVDEFVISFYLNSNFSSVIDDCIKFVFSKGVRLVHLDFAPNCRVLLWERPYAFPCLDVSAVHDLRDLRLEYVDIDQKALDSLLGTCPLLETLFLRPQKPENLVIAGETLKLKCLTIELGPLWKQRIEISAPNLTSLTYGGQQTVLHLNYAPHLSEFCAHDLFENYSFRLFVPLFHFVFQLKKLSFIMTLQMVGNSLFSYPLTYPEFVNLEQLELTIRGTRGTCVLWPIILVKASPLLQRFAVTFSTSANVRKEWQYDQYRIREATKFSHQSLKVVEMNMMGLSSEIEFAQHLLKIDAPSLENVVIDTSLPLNIMKRFCEGLTSTAQIVIRTSYNEPSGERMTVLN